MLSIEKRAGRWRAGGLCAVVCAVSLGLPGHAAAQRTTGMTLTIEKLPTGRTTIRQLAAYYYGAAQMSFVIDDANPWLRDFPANRSLKTHARLTQHPTIRIPTLRGKRPVGPA